jgi:hypothetical protein
MGKNGNIGRILLMLTLVIILKELQVVQKKVLSLLQSPQNILLVVLDVIKSGIIIGLVRLLKRLIDVNALIAKLIV